VNELRTSLLEEELTGRIPFGVLFPGIIVLPPVLQTPVAVEAFHAITNSWRKERLQCSSLVKTKSE